MSLMDHTPGQRQFRDEEKLREYYRGKGAGKTDAELDMLFAQGASPTRRPMRRPIMRAGRGVGAVSTPFRLPAMTTPPTRTSPTPSAIGVSVAEFPTTMEAARGVHQAGIGMLMGAPNVVRGGSHSGNIAAVDLAREGLLDILSSDYIPSSLLMAALQLPSACSGDRPGVGDPHRHQGAGGGGRPRTIAARSRRASVPTLSASMSRATFRWCARYGGKGTGWRERST